MWCDGPRSCTSPPRKRGSRSRRKVSGIPAFAGMTKNSAVLQLTRLVMREPMSEPQPPANDAEALDPEILALLDFEAVPRQRVVAAGWTAALQREFIARLAVCG